MIFDELKKSSRRGVLRLVLADLLAPRRSVTPLTAVFKLRGAGRTALIRNPAALKGRTQPETGR
ncbi:MAG: hypothetical protein ABIJ56_04895 [Pseudomonadota bacterium]